MGALGHTLTPFCAVCRQFFGFIPGDIHVLQILSDDVHHPYLKQTKPRSYNFHFPAFSESSWQRNGQSHRSHIAVHVCTYYNLTLINYLYLHMWFFFCYKTRHMDCLGSGGRKVVELNLCLSNGPTPCRNFLTVI